MATDEGEGIDQAEASHGSQECMPCRGTGRVISNLGGTASKVTCPWCEGDGTRRHGIDAQAHWQGEAAAEGPPQTSVEGA
jgi:DnaJ-class molecular chaperone